MIYPNMWNGYDINNDQEEFLNKEYFDIIHIDFNKD